GKYFTSREPLGPHAHERIGWAYPRTNVPVAPDVAGCVKFASTYGRSWTTSSFTADAILRTFTSITPASLVEIDSTYCEIGLEGPPPSPQPKPSASGAVAKPV